MDGALLILLLLGCSLTATQACSSECCQSGGFCGDPVFDNCVGGSWNYKVDCSPHYHTCCLPNEPQTTTRRTTRDIITTRTTVPTTQPTNRPTGGSSPSSGQTPSLPSSCGIVRSSRIVHGEDAVRSRWPWIAQLERDYFGWGQWEHFCGASLINNEWLVTAAHCVAKYNEPEPSMFRVVMGEHDRTVHDGNEKIIPVSKIVVHEEWSADIPGSPNDLALLQLSEPVDFTDYIQPLCLPAAFNEDFYPGENCWISGWGDTKSTGNNNILQEARLNITEWAECQLKWVTGTGGKDYVKPSHVCVGNGVPGACNGDSGGPLVCERSGRHILVGATSFGAAGCLETEAPNVYTKISYFIDWITQKIN